MPTTKTVETPTRQKEQVPHTPLDALIARIAALEKRLAQVEGMLQNSPAMALSPEMVSHIAGIAVNQVQESLLTPLGMSGFPARGDA